VHSKVQLVFDQRNAFRICGRRNTSTHQGVAQNVVQILPDEDVRARAVDIAESNAPVHVIAEEAIHNLSRILECG
jgi:hypothetical protein